MPPHLAQVLNTLAHEIRTPLAVSQGYVKLYLDGRLTDVDDTRKAFEQTRHALGALDTLCVDMGRVSALSESSVSHGVPERTSVADFVTNLRAADEVADASWQRNAGDGLPAAAGDLVAGNPRELVQAVAIVSKAAFDEARDALRVVQTGTAAVTEKDNAADLIVLAGTSESMPALQSGPDTARARAVDFVKGGQGLKLIWAAFVLDKHRVRTWTHSDHRASVGFRIPLVHA